MKTGKAVMIRKPKDMAELLKLTKKYLEEAEEVIIEKTIKLPNEAYRELIETPVAKTFDFLKNQGGTKDGKMLVVKVQSEDQPTILIDSEGYGYARYMGIALS